MKKRAALAAATTVVLATGGFAQQWSSFDLAGFTGVRIIGTGLTRTLELDAGAKMYYGSQWYDVVSLFGFYALHQKANPGNDLMGGLGGTAQNGWGYGYTNGDGGEVAGWDHPASAGRLFTPMSGTASLTFTFPTSLNLPYVEDLGLHVAADRAIEGRGDGTGNTGYFKYEEAVPEPFTLALGLAGLGVAIARRRRA